MKIEKISDTQIKVFLNQSDLKERNIKLAELAYGSEKTQALFREMMEQAIETCGFEVENSPLMIEAIPVSPDGIMIIVSKVNESSQVDNKFNLLPPSKEERKFRKKQITEDSDCETPVDSENILIYSFASLEDISKLAPKISRLYTGTNILYKYNDRYFLALQNDNISDCLETDTLDLILSEYGRKHVSTIISKYFLIEHGEVLIKNNAVKTFAQYL